MAKESVDPLCQKAQRCIAEGHYAQARRDYLQALGLKADSPDVHYGLATVCFLLNDLSSAAHHFREVTRLDPLRAGAFVNLAAVYNRLEQLDDAIHALLRGVPLDSHRAEEYYHPGMRNRRKGQPELDSKGYREATRINPGMTDAHRSLATL